MIIHLNHIGSSYKVNITSNTVLNVHLFRVWWGGGGGEYDDQLLLRNLSMVEHELLLNLLFAGNKFSCLNSGTEVGSILQLDTKLVHLLWEPCNFWSTFRGKFRYHADQA